MRKLLFGSVIAMISSVAMATPDGPPATTNQSAPKASKAQVADEAPQPAAPKKICKNLDVGFSHRSERVCMTAKQWEAYDRGDS